MTEKEKIEQPFMGDLVRFKGYDVKVVMRSDDLIALAVRKLDESL